MLNESGHNLDIECGDDLASQKKGVDTNSDPLDDQIMEDGDKREDGDLASGDLRTELDLKEKVSLPETSNVQVIGDVSSGWKIVMHEESNSYYYWNTESGETSWEVPDVLAEATKLTCDQKMPSADGTETVPVGTQEAHGYSNSDMVEGSSNTVPQGLELYGDGSQMNEWNIGCHNGSGIDPSSHLVKCSEALLERLKLLQGYEMFFPKPSISPPQRIHTQNYRHTSFHIIYLPFWLFSFFFLGDNIYFFICFRSKDHMQGLNWITKYMLEVEIRLFDFKSLLSYGSSLLPFWMHSEIQLKRLESAINDEMSKIVNSGESNEASHASFSRGEINFQESMGCKIESHQTENKQLISSLDDLHGTLSVDAVTEDEEVKGSVLKAEHVSAFDSPTRHIEDGASEQVHGVVIPDESTTKNEVCAEEDVDMDVDMEVEDSNSAGVTSIAYVLNSKEIAATEQPVQSSPPSLYTSLVSEDTFAVPPPPDEEWIPPPPPDNEQVPPPPPDEPPPEPPYPPLPSYLETGQPSYAEHYNFSYPVSSFDYYGHTVAAAPGGNYYGHVEGCQVAIPHLPVYYGADPSTAQVAANPVEPVTYYGLQDGTGPAPSVVSSVDSSQFHSEAAPLSSDNLASDHPISINSFAGAGSSGSSMEVPSTSATVQEPATVMANDTIRVPLTNTVSAAPPIPATSVVAKAQSKGKAFKQWGYVFFMICFSDKAYELGLMYNFLLVNILVIVHS